ncbi:DUF4928 domain-containing protein [Rhodococcus sp. KBW08]|nr:DUF4928 domain-containing protein [Rhodococcus sp. KBW08]
MSTPTVMTMTTSAASEQVWQKIEPAVNDWYESKRSSIGVVNKNVMNAGLIIADHMVHGVPMNPANYLGLSQVKGLSGTRIRKILALHGEMREFTKEGGRTSRATKELAGELADVISESAPSAGYGSLSFDEQTEVRMALQVWFVGKVQSDHFAKERLSAVINPEFPVRAAIAALLNAARAQGGNSAGAVAQHLVGAKLKLRFPKEKISNHSYTTADDQTARPGDFSVGDTAIHVTMAPSEALFQKCQKNLHDGFRPLVLVPENRVDAGRQIAETTGVGERVSVQAIEDYVGNNIEEVGGLSAQGIRAGLKALLETYNDRVCAVESDPALQISIPSNL